MGILTSARVPPNLLGQTVKVNVQVYAYCTLFIGKRFTSVRKASPCITKSSDTELQRVVHTPEGVVVVHLTPVFNPEFTSASVGSSPRSYLFIFATVLIDVHTAPKCLTEPIRYVMNHFRDRRGAASLRYRNRTEITVVRER